MPTIPGVFSVPPRRPFSCDPPFMKGKNRMPRRTYKRAHALRAVELVGGEREEIHAQPLHMQSRFSRRLAPHRNARAARVPGPWRRTRAPAGSHRFRCWRSSRKSSPPPATRPANLSRSKRPSGMHRRVFHRPRKAFRTTQNRRVLDRRNHRRTRADELVHRMQRRVHTLSAAAGENDLVRLRADPFRHLAARVFNRLAGRSGGGIGPRGFAWPSRSHGNIASNTSGSIAVLPFASKWIMAGAFREPGRFQSGKAPFHRRHPDYRSTPCVES